MEISVLEGNSGTKVRKVNPTKRKLAKDQRYRNKTLDVEESFVRPCNHDGKSYACNKITLADITKIRERFYVTPHKTDQEVRLCHMISATSIQRKRPVKDTPRSRTFSVSYFLQSSKRPRPVRVCLAFFTAALGISKRRVSFVAKLINEGRVPKERRGGDRISTKSEPKKNKIREFIGNLRGRESHYNRFKSKRIYLSADLSIAKLHKTYNLQAEEEFKASLSMFTRIFNREYNIGFSSPAADCCAVCTRLTHTIKKEKDEQKKRAAMLELRIHKQRSKAFYELSRENPPECQTFCFDMQQVQPLPRTPVNDAFYAHQISYYVFCCVDMKSRNPTFYTWTEDQAGRGSEQIGSALLDYLDTLDLENIKVLRLFCDGCGGQNRNSHVVHALYYWLKKKSPLNLVEIKMFFPVRGHSFLPADRVFGRVEKKLRKHPTLVSVEQYADIYKEFGVVKELGKDWTILNIKRLESNLKKIVGISEYKRICIQKKVHTGKQHKKIIKVKCHKNFRYEGLDEIFQSIIKRRKTDENMKLESVKLGRSIPEKKKKSLKHLMSQQFGAEWETDASLQWYRQILCEEDRENELQDNDSEHELEQECDCLEEDIGVHI